MKVFGINNISILATLFLLSYTKILKTIITALNFTQVLQGSAKNTSDQLVPYYVWTHDGNIEYLKGKHIPLSVYSSHGVAHLLVSPVHSATYIQSMYTFNAKEKKQRLFLHI